MNAVPRPTSAFDLALVLTLLNLLWPFAGQVSAVETAPWLWSEKIPAAFTATSSPRAHLAAAEVEAYFKASPAQPKIQAVIDHFGPPDGVSRQVPNSLTKGSARFLPDGHTLRFLLDDGGEMHLWSAGQYLAGLVIRYEKDGKGHFLWGRGIFPKPACREPIPT